MSYRKEQRGDYIMNKQHTFVICAYKESPYLEECIESLEKQKVKSIIKIVTSTPCDYIQKIADKHGIPCIVNTGKTGISEDWNFAFSQADTPYMTIAHQDDVYLPDYTRAFMKYIETEKKPLIFFTDYAELRDGEVVKDNELLNVKRMMLVPLKSRMFWKSRWMRRRVLSFGSPICCPSVGYCKDNLPEVVFRQHFRSCEDWEAWEMLSKLKGSFVYCNKILTYHRIHEGSETTAIIQDNGRSAEELEMYKKFWPSPIAKMLVKMYARGQKSNGI